MKILKSVFASLLCVSLLTACGKETPLLTAADYELNQDTNTTSRGIGIGDTPEAFLKAYGSYDIETSIEYGAYQALDTDEIPFTDSIRTILPTFFIDGTPVTIEQICMENEIERADLLSLLSSDEYLQKHTVIYNYLIFTWDGGLISDIHSEFMDYNEDASYYEDLEAEPVEEE
ncbi:MAG: hypothetical protein NC341_06280 [Blautia sp.]|nr:hypothetical protein [Blautia sp.]MCM1201028.1 hypothetical protein [Bacteroides fragilis]